MIFASLDFVHKVWLCTPSLWEAEALWAARPELRQKILVTGVGAVFSTETLWRTWCATARKPEVVIVVGLAGSYDHALKLYQGTQVRADHWAGLVRRKGYRLEALPKGLWKNFSLRVASMAPSIGLLEVEGLTIEAVSANRREAALWRRYYPTAQLETQENAAFLRFGAVVGLPVYALRMISNYVGRRWHRTQALRAFSTFAGDVVLPLYDRLLDRSSAPS